MGQYFKIGINSKLASKFLPDDAFFVAASKYLPYRSYLCCVVAFRLSGYSAITTNKACVVSSILAEIMFGIQERARSRHYEC